MEEEDRDFFVLVLGVLAAIILVVSWWFTTGGIATPAIQTSNAAAVADDDDDHGDDDAQDHNDADDDVAEPDEASEDAAPAEEPEVAEEEVTPPTDDDDEAAAPALATVFDAVAADSDLSVVRDLLRDNDLDQALAVTGPFTVFAPSNDAVSLAAGSDTTVALLDNDTGAVLTYHVVPGSYTLQELTEVAQSQENVLNTVQGEPITLTLDGDTLLINGATAVSPESAQADNGLVYTLNNVLVPPLSALNTLVGLDPILFATGSADIQAESFATLDQFVEILGTSTVDVTIEGHTDSSGDPILNQNLSQSRARSVLNYLVANGVDESRLSAQGFGPDRPVADNDTEEGRALNRRIEFTVG